MQVYLLILVSFRTHHSSDFERACIYMQTSVPFIVRVQASKKSHRIEVVL